MRGAASFDRSGRYRYSLTRTWDDDGPRACFVLLNPSTADRRRDDPTIRRCIRFARDWGYGSLECVNAFAFRATRPADLLACDEPVGARNDLAIRRACGRASLVLLAWGNHAAHLRRDRRVVRLVRPHTDVRTLGLTDRGQPRHPLYVRADTPPIPFDHRSTASAIARS